MIASVTLKVEDRYYVTLEFILEKGQVEAIHTCAVTEGNVTVVFRNDLSIKEIKYSGLFPSIGGNLREKELTSYKEMVQTTLKNFEEDHLQGCCSGQTK